MNSQERQQILEEKRAERLASDREYVARRFGISVDDVKGFNSGCCYSKVWVKTREAAEKVSAAVRGETVNGGMLHGMGLGGIDTSIDKDITIFEVIV